MNELLELRKQIHHNPELANKEFNTAKRLIEFIKKFKPDKIIENIGGTGIAFLFESGNPGPTVMFRSELDALPIFEINTFDYKSKNVGVSHKCGHDGHMVMVAGIAESLLNARPSIGRVILLYQPAEETGEGAFSVVSDPEFKKLKPDYIFALHNLPGFKKGKIIIRENTFAAASKGIIIRLEGKTSHAAEPENGLSPAIAISDLIKHLNNLPSNLKELNDFALLTIIHVQLGEAAFGTSPGTAVLMGTLRAFNNDDMKLLSDEAINIANEISEREKLKIDISWTEEFPATVNNSECVKIIQDSIKAYNFEFETVSTPFRWSEDFGHFTSSYKGAMFGLGSGERQPDLHNPDYDFPDEIIKFGVKTFEEIYKLILNPGD